MSLVEEGYLDFSARARHAFAGFGSITIEDYAKIQLSQQRLFFDLSHDEGEMDKLIPGYFQMLGGPAFGTTALIQIIKHFEWNRVAFYSNAEAGTVRSSVAFVSGAAKEGIELETTLRESSGANKVEEDYETLMKCKANVFIFFGGLRSLL
jgi:hypothetical protein